MAQDESYQTKTYHERGGDAFVMGSGGMGRVESGGAFRKPTAIIGIVSVSVSPGVYSVKVPPFSYGTIIFSAESNIVSGSFRLAPCSVGADLMLILRGDLTGGFTNHSTGIDVSISGADCIILLSTGGAGSGWEFYTSAASDAWVHLKCFTDNIWSIVDSGGDVNE